MEITLAEKYDIRQLFTDMNSKKNFLELLNFSKKFNPIKPAPPVTKIFEGL